MSSTHRPQPPGWSAAPPARPSAALAAGALACGVLAVLSCWTVLGGIALGVLATVLGVAAHNRVRAGRAEGGGMAVAGIITGLLATALAVVFLVIGASVFRGSSFPDYVRCMGEAGNDRAAQQRCEDAFRTSVEQQLGVTPAPR